jgi:hypothetical protein
MKVETDNFRHLFWLMRPMIFMEISCIQLEA